MRNSNVHILSSKNRRGVHSAKTPSTTPRQRLDSQSVDPPLLNRTATDCSTFFSNNNMYIARKSTTKYSSQNPGVSLLIAIMFVSAFLLVMGGLYTATSKVISGIANRETEAKAEYLAQSAFELASYWAATHAEGQNFSDFPAEKLKVFAALYTAAGELGISGCQNSNCIGFDVTGRAENVAEKKVNGLNSSWFSVPVRGTGNAESVCVDSSLADDGCNWNKIYVGDNVSIPLYYVDANGTTQVLSGDFKLRVRTPKCSLFGFGGNTNCDVGGRVLLYPAVVGLAPGFNNYPFRNPTKDPVLVQWTISDTVNNASIIALDTPDFFNSNLRNITNDASQNSELSGGRINDANPNVNPAHFITNYIVLERNLAGKDIQKNQASIDTFINNAANLNGKPTLSFNFVDQARIDNDNLTSNIHGALDNFAYFVPYLEYQILTQQAPVTDTKSYLYSWSEFGGFKKEVKKELSRSVSGGGFALENF